MTEVIVTGTGTPIPEPGRAGPGVLVRHEGTVLLFDAGRATALRMIEAGIELTQLTAVFVTHHHSDHLMGLPDVALTRWVQDRAGTLDAALPVVAPNGAATEFVSAMLDIWHADIELRHSHGNRTERPRVDVRGFDVADGTAQEVFRTGDVRVEAVRVRHEPVTPAVGYRITTPSGTVVISGDTRVCQEIEQASAGVDVLVHEVVRKEALERLGRPKAWLDAIPEYHADSVDLGRLAAAAGVGHLVLTHLLPAPLTPEDEDAYVADIRQGGYDGPVTVAKDLDTVKVRSGEQIPTLSATSTVRGVAGGL